MYSYQNHTLPFKFHCNLPYKVKFIRMPFCRTRIKQFSVFYQGPKFYSKAYNINL